MVYRVCFPKFIRFPFVDKELSYEFALHQAKLHLNLQRAVDEAFGFAFRGAFGFRNGCVTSEARRDLQLRRDTMRCRSEAGAPEE